MSKQRIIRAKGEPGGAAKVHMPTVNANSARLQTLVEEALMSRSALIAQFTSKTRNYDEECGYPTDITAEDYRAAFNRNGLGHRIVEVWPQETWAIVPEVTENKEAEESEFEDAWESLVKRHNLWNELYRIDLVSGIGRFGVLLLGFNDGRALNEPVRGLDKTGKAVKTNAATKSGNPLKLLFLRSFDESAVKIKKREEDTQNPRYGQPVMYEITFKDNDEGQEGLKGPQSRPVHWTRCIHVADNRDTSVVLGTPRMQVPWNRVEDGKKVVGGSAEMFWKGAFPGLALEMAPGLTDTDTDLDDLKDEVDDYQSKLKRYLILFGMTAKSLSPQIADPTAQYEVLLEDIAITLGVPKRIFRGTEEAQLAGSQDAKAWNKRLAKRQNTYVTPMLIRPFIDRLIKLGVLPSPALEDDGETFAYVVTWPDLNAATDDEKAKVALTTTQALTAYASSDLTGIMTFKSFLTLILKFEVDVVEAILAEAEEMQAEMEAEEEKLKAEGVDPNDPNADPEADPADEDDNGPPSPSVTVTVKHPAKAKKAKGKKKGAKGKPTANVELLEETEPALGEELAKAKERIANLEKAPKLEFTLKDERVTNLPGATVNNVIQPPAPPNVTNEINLPPQAPPVVNIQNETTVQPAPVPPPLVIPAPVVPAPIVNVTTPAPSPAVVNVTNEITVKPSDVVIPPPPARDFKVKRDSEGRITGGSSTPTT